MQRDVQGMRPPPGLPRPLLQVPRLYSVGSGKENYFDISKAVILATQTRERLTEGKDLTFVKKATGQGVTKPATTRLSGGSCTFTHTHTRNHRYTIINEFKTFLVLPQFSVLGAHTGAEPGLGGPLTRLRGAAQLYSTVTKDSLLDQTLDRLL